MEFKRTAPPSIIIADFFITWIGSRFFAAFIRTFNFVLFRDLLSLFSCCWAKRNKFTTLWCGCFEIINLSNATQLVLFFLAGWARRPIAQFSRSHFFFVNVNCFSRSTTGWNRSCLLSREQRNRWWLSCPRQGENFIFFKWFPPPSLFLIKNFKKFVSAKLV